MEDIRSARWRRRIPAAIIAIPVVWAVVAHVMGASARPMAAAPRRPGLAFAQHLVDLGLVHPSEEVFAHFDFTNRGTGMVKVTDLVPSCGCLKPELQKKDYYPGQSGSFLLRVQTANEAAGQKEYTVKVKYNDPEPQETEVVFRVTLPENKVFVQPRSLLLYQLSAEPLPEHVIDVVDRREGSPLRIVRVDCLPSSVARVEIADAEQDENGHTHNRVKVTFPAQLPPGRTDAVVRIFTDDRDYKSLRVPMQVHAKRMPTMAGKKPPIVDPSVQPASAQN